jgi:hypothetical protein
VISVILPADLSRATEEETILLLKRAIYWLYIIAFLSLFHCAWLIYEQTARLIGWEQLIELPAVWLVIVSVSR